MIIIKLVTILLCAGLNFIGGNFWHNARRYIMPAVIGVSISIVTHVWWLGLTVLPSMGTLSIGYGEKSILHKYFSDFWVRFVWMALSAITIGLGCFIFGHLAWYLYILYILVLSIVCAILRNLNEVIGDLLFGSLIGSIVFLVR